MDDIYHMKLHETISIKHFNITRVAGGWIYEHVRLDSNSLTSVFVRFDNEFMKDES